MVLQYFALSWKLRSLMSSVLSSNKFLLHILLYVYSQYEHKKIIMLWELTQILIRGPYAAHSQYLLGEKHRAVIMSLWSKVWRCFPSFKSQSIAFMSLPPDAHREPSGETVTVLRYPEWPKWLIFNLQFVRCQTCKLNKI